MPSGHATDAEWKKQPPRPRGTIRSAATAAPFTSTTGDGIIQDIGFEGTGCAILLASASMMTLAVSSKRPGTGSSHC